MAPCFGRNLGGVPWHGRHDILRSWIGRATGGSLTDRRDVAGHPIRAEMGEDGCASFASERTSEIVVAKKALEVVRE